MEPRLYSRLLLRLLALPIAALTVLALILGYGLERIQESASTVDRADVVILHGNRLIKLMVDEETGLRGFLLTGNPVFLQPLHEADQQIAEPFPCRRPPIVHGPNTSLVRSLSQGCELDESAQLAALPRGGLRRGLDLG